MDEQRRRLIEAIHAAPGMGVFAVTGGGATAAAELLAVPGASRTVLEVVVPYHPNALADFLGSVPEHACSADTGRALAARALARAEQLAPGEGAFGLGVTASLATDRPKRGDHRFHLTVQGSDRGLTLALTLAKGRRDRAGEEAVLTAVVLNALAEFLGVPDRLDVPLLPGEEILSPSPPRGEGRRRSPRMVPGRRERDRLSGPRRPVARRRADAGGTAVRLVQPAARRAPRAGRRRRPQARPAGRLRDQRPQRR